MNTQTSPDPANYKPNDLRLIDPTLAKASALVGEDAILIPANETQTATMAFDTKPITLEQSKEVPHQVALTRSYIAVQLGAPSDLCGIFCRNRQILDAFVASNALLRDSLIVGGPTGFVIFVKLKGAFSISKIDSALGMGWLADDTAVAIAPRGPLESQYQIVNPGRPVTVSFNDLVWPSPLKEEFSFVSARIMYGNPTIKNSRNRLIPNYNFWSYLFFTFVTVAFDPHRKCFYTTDVQTNGAVLSHEEVSRRLSQFLAVWATWPGCALLQAYAQPPLLGEFLKTFKYMSAKAVPEDPLKKFLTDAVEAQAGSSIATGELYQAHLEYCKQHQLPPYPETVFAKLIPALLDELFHARRSKKLVRHDAYCRGFRHVRLKNLNGSSGRWRMETGGDGSFEK